MENKPTCIIMTGLPCSGKSTVVKDLLEQFPEKIVLSTDDYIEFIAARRNMTYNEVFRDNIRVAQQFFDRELTWAVENKKDIIVDRTNLTIRSRKEIMQFLTPDYKVFSILVKSDWDTIIKRNVRPGKIIPVTVLKDMSLRLEQPRIAEGFTEVQHV